jgi:putative holliday junction resolvase
MARILALDYGLARTGIAVTDPMQMIASGLTTVATRELLDWLQQYCKQEEVERFVIGLPLRADGSSTEMSENTELFIVKLEKSFPNTPVSRHTERHSSQEAARVIFAAGVKKQKRQEKGLLDKVAAAVILQNYMHETVWK